MCNACLHRVLVCSALVVAIDGLAQTRAVPSDTHVPSLASLDERSTRPYDVPEGLSASDWSSIRVAYEAGRHRVFAVEGGYHAYNPRQGWSTRFDGRGFTTEPDGGGWSWGLKLERYGFVGLERTVGEPTQVTAEGHRVAYEWDATLTECSRSLSAVNSRLAGRPTVAAFASRIAMAGWCSRTPG